MLQNLPFVLSVAVLSYLLVMWIYLHTFSGVQRVMFFVFGCIGLTALYAILAAGYFGVTYAQGGWEIWAIIGAVIALLTIGSLAVSNVGMPFMVSRIRSGKIGKNLLESRKIAQKVEQLKETLSERAERDKIHEDLKASLSAGFRKAADGNSLDYMIGLLEKGADFNRPDGHERTALLRIKGRNDTWQKAVFLLKLGADVNARDEDGLTPLMNAAGQGDPDLIHCLLAGGADTQARDNEGLTALMYFVKSGSGMISTTKSRVTLCLVCDWTTKEKHP